MALSSYNHNIRVRYADTDQMGVVYHARYFEWFEAARTEMLRARGKAYDQLEKEGVFLPVIEAYCRYRNPVRYDELIQVKTTIQEVNRLKIRLHYEITDNQDKVQRIEGYTLHCFMDPKGRPIRVSKELLSLFQ